MLDKKHLLDSGSVKNTITVAVGASLPTLRQGKAFKLLLFFADKVTGGLEPGSVHAMPISFLRNLLKSKDLSNEQIVSLVSELEGQKMDWDSYDSDYEGFSYIISSCIYVKSRGVLSFSFDPQFVKEYKNPKTPFKNLPLRTLMGFRSNYALKIYELAFQYYDPKRKAGKTPSYSKDDLFRLLSISSSKYKPGSGQWLRDAIRKPLEEVNEISDCMVEFHSSGQRGTRLRYWFTVKLNDQRKMAFVDNDMERRALALDPEEEEKRAKQEILIADAFLKHFDSKLNTLFSRSFTTEERKLWLSSLEQSPPTLSYFSSLWLAENYMKLTKNEIDQWASVVAEITKN